MILARVKGVLVYGYGPAGVWVSNVRVQLTQCVCVECGVMLMLKVGGWERWVSTHCH